MVRRKVTEIGRGEVYRSRLYKRVHTRPQRPRFFLVSTKNRDFWPGPTPEVHDSRTSRHSAHDKSGWFWSQYIVFTEPFKTGMSLDGARGSQRSNDWAFA